jgi:hypothetical protein
VGVASLPYSQKTIHPVPPAGLEPAASGLRAASCRRRRAASGRSRHGTAAWTWTRCSGRRAPPGRGRLARSPARAGLVSPAQTAVHAGARFELRRCVRVPAMALKGRLPWPPGGVSGEVEQT